MWRALFGLPIVVAISAGVSAPAHDSPGGMLFLAFASHRESNGARSKVLFYEHDGVANGKIVGAIDMRDSQYQPSLNRDGRYCVFASLSQQGVIPQRLLLWDREAKKAIELPQLVGANAKLHPTLSGDGKALAFASCRGADGGGGWDIFVFDEVGRKFLDFPQVNTAAFDERMPALSRDGRFLAYTSNAQHKDNLTDIYLCDRQDQKVDTLREMNSKHMDIEPALSADGRLIAFVSDRAGGAGGRDSYLYDRVEKKLLPLPGLNSVGHEQSPSLSPDGRFIVFVSERIEGEGGRDIYLYDRQTQRLLPTPGLNCTGDDFDPCVIVLPPVK